MEILSPPINKPEEIITCAMGSDTGVFGGFLSLEESNGPETTERDIQDNVKCGSPDIAPWHRSAAGKGIGQPEELPVRSNGITERADKIKELGLINGSENMS